MMSTPAFKDVIAHKAHLAGIGEPEVGGKGWNLFRIRALGCAVPPWCVVSTRVFDEAVGPIRDQFAMILDRVDYTEQRALEDASFQIRELVSQVGVPPQFSRELHASLDQQFGQDALLAVRSSVVGEDSPENSFAGQMDSFLNVRPSGVMTAIRMVWTSAFSSRSLLYRRRKGISPTEISTAVIIQEMVQSAASGVLFTRDPETRAEECVISAGFGLGEGVVGDLVKTDTYRVGWESGDIFREVPAKDCRVVLDTASQTGNRTESLPPYLQLRPVLTDAQIRGLRDVGIEAEKCFGAPQDIEWAIDECGRLFILQARPIVLTKDTVPPPKLRIWDNSNIVESYPGLTLPLTFSFIRNAYETSFRNAALGFRLLKKAPEKDLQIFRNMIGLLDGRVYYNLLNWYRMLSYLPGSERHRESWDQMIGISQKVAFPQSELSPLDCYWSLISATGKLLSVRRTAKTFFAHFASFYDRFKHMDLSAATEEELVDAHESLFRESMAKWHLTLYNDFCAMKYYDWLKHLCARWGLDGGANLHNNLLCGERGVESVLPVRSLVHLAEVFRSEPVYRALLSGSDNDDIWRAIQGDPQYAPLRNALEAHLQEFGDRGLEELKLETRSVREQPAVLIRLIKEYDQLGLSVEAMEAQEQSVRRDAERSVTRELKNPLKKLVFWFVLRNARLAIANRENMRFARSRLFGIVKNVFRRMADHFVEQDLLASTSDIFYLTVDEVFGYVQGTAVTQGLKAIVEIRKAEYEDFAQRMLKERIRTVGIPYLISFCRAGTGGGTGKALQGIGCSSGIAEGSAKVVSDPTSCDGHRDSILVAKSTDPGWVFLMVSSRGIVVEKGSVLSHTAIIGRELGIPTIVGVRDATNRIPDGARLSMDGSTGEVRWQ